MSAADHYCGACGIRIRRPGEQDDPDCEPPCNGPLRLAIVVFDTGAARRMVCADCRRDASPASRWAAKLGRIARGKSDPDVVCATDDATPLEGWPRGKRGPGRHAWRKR